MNDECRSIVETEWDCANGSNAFTNICLKISNTRKKLMEWSKTCFGNIKEEIELVQTKLALFYDDSLSAPPLDNRLALESKLN